MQEKPLRSYNEMALELSARTVSITFLTPLAEASESAVAIRC